MSSSLKISADTSEVKKSILDIGKTLRDLKGSKVQIFSAEDRNFLKGQVTKEMGLIKNKIKENRDEIKKLIETQNDSTMAEEKKLEVIKKITEAYKVQAKLGRQMGSLQQMKKGGVDSGSGGMMSTMMNFAKMIPGLAAVATIGYAVTKGVQANDQYKQGVPNRVRLKGLGVGDENFGSAGDLARVGLSEQDMIQRRADATATLGRSGTSQQSEMQKAGFERSFGLEGGTMTGIASQLRGSMGGQGANEAQMKLQAAVFASGIEDAIGPYLESATQLLSSINENGTTQTSEITNLLAQMTKDGERTPEQLAKTLGGINDAVKGASGEKSAFLQTAFARAGIGGGSIGGTKYAMEAGGIMGQDRASLEKRGYNKDLLNSMGDNGMFQGVGKRTGAISDLMRSAGGLKPGQQVSDVKDSKQMYGLNNLGNSVFGTKGDQGFDALLMFEKLQKKEITGKQFDDKIKEMQEGKDPSVQRLDKINASLAGQTDVLNKINTNLMEALGKEAVQAGNEITKTDNEGIIGVKSVGGAINDSGFTKGAGGITSGIGKAMNSGALGEGLYNSMFGAREKFQQDVGMSDGAVMNAAKKRRDGGTGFVGMSDEQIEDKVRKSLAKTLTAKDIGTEVVNALKQAPATINRMSIQLPDGKVTEKTIGK